MTPYGTYSDMCFSVQDTDEADDWKFACYLITPAKQIRCYDPNKSRNKETILDWNFGGVR